MSSFNPFGKKEEAVKKEEGEEKVEAKGDAPKDQNPDNGQPKDDSDDKKTVCEMKRGDYMIHVMIEQAKNLKVDAEDTVDPLVEVKCMGQKRFTTAQDDINNTGIAVWNEHIFFEPKNQEVEDLAQAKIEIKLMDKGFFKDALIGFYEFDLSYLYQQQDHALLHKWIIMSNPESENFGEVTGQLKISITICGEGDEQVGIEDDPHPEKEEIIQPPQIKPKFYQLRFRFFTAQKVVPMDSSLIGKKKTDLVIKLNYKTSKLKTTEKLIEEGSECQVNEEFLVPAQIPMLGGRLVFKVYDDDITGDELIGAIHFNIKDIIPDADGVPGPKNGLYDWKNIYGAPLGVSGHVSGKMNENPEIASFWKGRILVQCVAEETEKPLLLLQKIDPEEVDKSKVYHEPRTYAVSCFVAGLLSLPEDNQEYQVSLRIADKEWISGAPRTVKAKYNRFNVGMTTEDPLVTFPYINIQDIGTVYVYLHRKYRVGGMKRICYWRGNIMEFVNPNPEIKWIELEPDFAIGEVKEHYKAGIVGIKMSIHDVSTNGSIDWMNYPTWAKKIPKRPPNIKVRVFVWQARDIPAADDNGSSDPFVQILDSERTQNSQVIWDNVNPLFYEGLDAIYEANSVEELPPVIVDVFDMDENLTGNSTDFICRATLFVQHLSYSDGDTIPTPEWHNLYFKKGGPACGQILLSFAVVADDYNFKKQLRNLALEQQVEMKEFGVSMNILGLRGLQSPGLLPVRKAFLQFNLKSMVPPKLGSDLSNIRTEPKMAGSDPTLNTLIEFNAPLPVEELFCPRMSCSVFDNIAMGLSQPLIGTFVIPIGDLMHALAKERIEETEALEVVVQQVRKFVSGELMAANFKRILAKKQAEENEKLEAELEAVRVQQAIKDNLAKKMFKASLNDDDMDDATESLLQGDADEELRMHDRLIEKEESTEGPEKRLNADVILKLQNTVKGNLEQKRTGSNVSISDKMSRRSGSVGSVGSIESANKFDPKLKAALMAEQTEMVERKRRDADEERKKAEAEFHSGANVIMPRYERDDQMQVDRECHKPPEQMFIGLGWDEDMETKRRHYRRFYPDELENVREILPNPTPFNQYDLKRGQSRGASVSIWAKLTNKVKTDESGEATSEKVVGRFKAVIEVEDKIKKAIYIKRKAELIETLIDSLKELAQNRGIVDFDLDIDKLETMEGRYDMKQSLEPLSVNHMNIVGILADIESDVILKRMLLKTAKMVVRVYMVEGFDLASRDMGGFSDPYLKLKLGKKLYDDCKNYIMDEPNPKFCKHWDFETTFPGCPMLFIDAMDYDDLFGDDLIGSTSVDLEDRYFLPEWRALHDKPVEYRQLYHPSSGVSQGQLKMWVEINPASVAPEDKEVVWDISQKPPEEFQMRVSVFDTKDIKMMDDEGTSDVFIRSFFDSRKDALETDTHYRCQTGTASFNYRLNYKVEVPRKDYRFTVQAFDRDFFKSNDIIGSAIIDLKKAFEDCALCKRPLKIDKVYYEAYMRKEGDKPYEFDKEGDSFWLPMISKNNDTGELEDNGHVRIRIDITTVEFAEKQKVGSAREDPNIEPFLPPPIGRLSFSFNPCDMYKQLIGPAVRRKIAIWCFVIICSALCVMILYYLVPIIIGNLLTDWIAHGF